MYNPCNSNIENKHSNTISNLLHAIKKHLNRECISLKDHNLHHSIWERPDISHTD